MSRGCPTRPLSGLLLLALLLQVTRAAASVSAPIGVSNLGPRLCQANPFTVWANETGQGSAGALMVWLLATRDLLPYCDLLIIAPEGAGVVMHFLSASLRRAHPRRLRQETAGSAYSAVTAGCVDTVSVVHALSAELAVKSNETAETIVGTTMVEPTCTTAMLTNRHHVSAHEPSQALTRIRLTVGDRDERSIVGYSLQFNVYLHGNWTRCPYADQFRCKDDNCIWNRLICDGLQNCLDRSDEYEATYAVCRHPLRMGLHILCFFGAVGAIVTTLLTLDALGRYVLHSRQVRSKQRHRPRVRTSPVLFVEEEQPAAMMRGVDGATINLLDRDLALFEKRGGAETRVKKKGRTAEGSKKPAPIEEAPRLSSSPKAAATSKASPIGHSLSRVKSLTSVWKPAILSQASSSRQDASEGKFSSLSYDIDFDYSSSKLRVPDVTPENSVLVEDDKHFPSDKPLKSSEAFMRLLELTVGKKSHPEHIGVLPAILPRQQSSSPTSSKTVSLEPRSSSATSALPMASTTTPLSSRTQSRSPLPQQKTAPKVPPETRTPSMISFPSVISSSQSAIPRHSTSKSRQRHVSSSPSSLSASRTEGSTSKEPKAKDLGSSQSNDSKSVSHRRSSRPSKKSSEKRGQAQDHERKKQQPS